MYEHHKRAIENLKKYYEGDPEILGVVLGGSVAKGLERPDSDIDGMVIVTPERYEKLKAEGRITECITGYCDYEGGYFDIKYMTKEYLEAAADHGSEPTGTPSSAAAAFLIQSGDSRHRGADSCFPKAGKAGKTELLLRCSAVCHRLFLAIRGRSHSSFPHRFRDCSLCPAHGHAGSGSSLSLQQEHGKIHREDGKQASSGLGALRRFVENPTTENMKSFVNYVLENIEYTPPKDFHEIGTQFVADNEQWWYKHRPFIAEW